MSYAPSIVEGSVYDPHGEGSNIRVAEWVSDLATTSAPHSTQPPTPTERSESRLSYAPTVFSRTGSHTRTSATSDVALSPKLLRRRTAEVVEDESDDELLVDFTNAALEAGNTAFKAQEWSDADSLLHEYLTSIKQLSKRFQDSCEVFEVQYKLTVCAYHTKEPSETEQALIALIQQSPASSDHRSRQYDAAHLLAQVYMLMDGELERARLSCENALRSRSKLFGKTHEATLESLALMSVIYHRMGKSATAKVYEKMLPENQRALLLSSMVHQQKLRVSEGTVRPGSTSGSSEISQETLSGHNNDKYRGVFPGQIAPARHGIEPRDQPSPISYPQTPQTPTQLHPGFQDGLDGRLSLSHARPPQLSQQYARPGESPYWPQPLIIRSAAPSRADTASTYSRDESAASIHMSYDRGSSLRYIIDPEKIVIPTSGLIVDEGPSRRPNAATRKLWCERLGIKPSTKIEQLICADSLDDAMGRIDQEVAGSAIKGKGKWLGDGPKALHLAALFGDIDIIEALIQNGADIDAPLPQVTPQGTRVNRSPLHFAAKTRQPAAVQKLLKKGANFSMAKYRLAEPGALLDPPWLDWSGPDDFQLIVKILTLFFQHGWDINQALDPMGRKLLHQAATIPDRRGPLQRGLLEFLILSGADVIRKDADGKVPLHTAVFSRSSGAVSVLLGKEGEAQLQACGESGLNALLIAIVQNAPLDIIRTLLAAGADVQAKCSVWSTFLPKSLLPRSMRILTSNAVQILAGPAPVQTVRIAVTPLQVAQASGRRGVVELLSGQGSGPVSELSS